MGLYCVVKIHDPSFNRFCDIGGLKAENRQFCLPRPWYPDQGKAIDFGTNGNRVYTFLLVINSPILHRFGDMARIRIYPILI